MTFLDDVHEVLKQTGGSLCYTEIANRAPSVNIIERGQSVTTNRSEIQSLAEVFHLVKNLIPEDQEVVTASPDMTVVETVQLMQKHNFSQLPVVAGDTVLGVFSFRSLTTQLLKMGQITEYFGELPVDEFME